jgi:hypothetical protein
MSVDRWHRPALRARILAGDEPEWLRRHPRREYLRQAVLATPPWVTKEELRECVRERDRLTAATGVRHVCDHKTPLTHAHVCGLNVPANIQVIPWATNARKSNHWCEWQGDLFA